MRYCVQCGVVSKGELCSGCGTGGIWWRLRARSRRERFGDQKPAPARGHKRRNRLQ